MARKHWRRPDLAIGKRLRVAFNGQGDWLTVVGVAANASTGGLTADASAPMLYVGEGERHQPALIVRTNGGAAPIAALRGLVASMDRRLPPQTVTDVESALKDSVARPRFTMLLLTAFTVLALALAAVGLYGVMSYAVSQRTREIGIRIALGATRRNIARAVIGQGVMLAVCGIVIGLVGAHWATRLIEKMLYGIPRTDPASFAAGSIVLLATALLACVVPMRRAVAVDPLLAMRAE
jgi:putative ABC transport system permease protein